MEARKFINNRTIPVTVGNAKFPEAISSNNVWKVCGATVRDAFVEITSLPLDDFSKILDSCMQTASESLKDFLLNNLLRKKSKYLTLP